MGLGAERSEEDSVLLVETERIGSCRCDSVMEEGGGNPSNKSSAIECSLLVDSSIGEREI